MIDFSHYNCEYSFNSIEELYDFLLPLTDVLDFKEANWQYMITVGEDSINLDLTILK